MASRSFQYSVGPDTCNPNQCSDGDVNPLGPPRQNVTQLSQSRSPQGEDRLEQCRKVRGGPPFQWEAERT